MTVDCRELIAALDSYLMMDGRDETPMAERVARLMEAKRKCIAALDVEPAPADKGGPSDEELMALAEVSMYLPYVIADDSVDVSGDSLVKFARAVLARHGTPAPVPVAERLPGPGDCDDQGMCWWWAPKDPECPLTGHDSWGFYAGACIEDTHWLPHWALPLPEAQP